MIKKILRNLSEDQVKRFSSSYMEKGILHNNFKSVIVRASGLTPNSSREEKDGAVSSFISWVENGMPEVNQYHLPENWREMLREMGYSPVETEDISYRYSSLYEDSSRRMGEADSVSRRYIYWRKSYLSSNGSRMRTRYYTLGPSMIQDGRVHKWEREMNPKFIEAVEKELNKSIK